MKHKQSKFIWLFSFLLLVGPVRADAQDKIKIAYSSTDTLNQIWTIAQDAGFYKKNGLDVELVYIGSTTVGIAAIVSQDVQVGNAAGSGVANARSEEHTSELQSRRDLVCRLLLEKKKASKLRKSII